MKIKKVLVVFGIIGVSFITNFNYVKASELDNKFYFDEWIPDIYIRKEYQDYVQNQQARFTRRQSDGIPMYCIQTGPLVYNDEIYTPFTDNLDVVTGYTKEQIEKVKLIAYYGYGYNGQYDDKWYAITQVLIWKTIYPYMDIYYTDTFRGNRIEKFVDEENHILELVNKRLLKPDFDDFEELEVGKEFTMVDKNNILNEFDIETSDNIEVTKLDKSLTIKAINTGDASIKLTKKANRFNYIPIVYMNDVSQNLFMAGDYDTRIKEVNFKVVKTEIPEEPKEEVIKEPPKEGEKEVVTIEVPNTYQDDNHVNYSSSLISILIGILLLNVKKK